MKKTIIVILSLLLIISLAGCNNQSSLFDPLRGKDPFATVGNRPVNSDPGKMPVEMPVAPAPSPEVPVTLAPQNTNDDSWGVFPFSFTAKDLYGNTVTEESLGEKQLFFVHLWGTWCPPCIMEMPDLAVVAREYSDRVGFLGLLNDYSTNLEGAISINESANKPDTFITIDAWLPELNSLLELVQTGYVPTTVIFTSTGEMFEPLIGAYGAGYAAILDEILEGLS